MLVGGGVKDRINIVVSDRLPDPGEIPYRSHHGNQIDRNSFFLELFGQVQIDAVKVEFGIVEKARDTLAAAG